MTDDLHERREATLGIAFFLAILVLVGSDLIFDYRDGTSLWHLAVETLILLAAIVGLWMGWRKFKATRIESRSLKHDLQEALEEARRWRRESRLVLDGLGAAIDRQFRRWNLTPAEAEVGMLLLKGLSFKEAAAVRDTSERTVREQARSLYKKAGLAGRSELSAFFLEDLLLPQEESGRPG